MVHPTPTLIPQLSFGLRGLPEHAWCSATKTFRALTRPGPVEHDVQYEGGWFVVGRSKPNTTVAKVSPLLPWCWLTSDVLTCPATPPPTDLTVGQCVPPPANYRRQFAAPETAQQPHSHSTSDQVVRSRTDRLLERPPPDALGSVRHAAHRGRSITHASKLSRSDPTCVACCTTRPASVLYTFTC